MLTVRTRDGTIEGDTAIPYTGRLRPLSGVLAAPSVEELVAVDEETLVSDGLAGTPIGLGVGAAVLLGLGFVLQQRMARLVPSDDTLSPRLLLDLIGKPLWLAGIAAMVGGQVLGAVALGAGDVSLIEPLLTTNLLFALMITRVVSARPLRAREWVGAVGLIAGVVVFLVCADPEPARGEEGVDPATGTGMANVISLAVVAALVAALTLVARGRRGGIRAGTLAGGAGLLFGMQDGLTRGVMTSLDSGVTRLLESWVTYVVVAIAIAGIFLMQNAFQAAPLRVSLPVIAAAEPLTGIGYGIGVYGERVQISPGSMAGEAVGLAVMILGVVLVTRGHALATHHRGASTSPVPARRAR